MLIWGIRETLFEGDKSYPQRCEDCGKWEQHGCVLAKYLHVVFIPVFLWETEAGLVCTKCGRLSHGGLIPPAVREDVRRTVFTPLRRAPYFIGLAMLAAFLLLGGEAKAEHGQRLESLLATPQKGDVYLVNLPDILEFLECGERRYGALRVSDISETHILFDVGTFLSGAQGPFREDARTGRIFEDNYYDGSVLLQERNSLGELLGSGTIAEIFRKP